MLLDILLIACVVTQLVNEMIKLISSLVSRYNKG